MKRIVVIGAGLIGASTAYAFARRGADVVLIDREQGPAQGASYANGGMLTPSMADPWNAPGVWRDLLRWYGKEDAPMLLRMKALPSLSLWGIRFLSASNKISYEKATALNVKLGLFSLKIMEAWRNENDLQYASAQNGTAKIYRDKAAFAAGVLKATSIKELGVGFEALDVDELIKLQPALRPIADKLSGAVYFPQDEAGDAQKFTAAIVEAGVTRGITTKWGAAISRISARSGAVCGVEIDGSVLEADRVVLCAGAYSQKLAASAGVGLAVKPVKGYSLTFPYSHVADSDRLTIPIIDDGLHAAVTPLSGRIRVAGTAEFTGFDYTLDEARVENLRTIMKTILPDQYSEITKAKGKSWAQFRPMHARGVPAIGPTHIKGLYLNTGHGHLGWTQAAGAGEALAQSVLGERAVFDLAPFAP